MAVALLQARQQSYPWIGAAPHAESPARAALRAEFATYTAWFANPAEPKTPDLLATYHQFMATIKQLWEQADQAAATAAPLPPPPVQYALGARPPLVGPNADQPDLFAAINPPIHLPPHALQTMVTALQLTQLQAAHIDYNQQYTDLLHLGVSLFIKTRNEALHSEQGLIARNDALFSIIRDLVPGLLVERNTETPSVTDTSRIDCWLGFQDEPPLVLIEEKRADAEIASARSDLQSKFVWMPHYGVGCTVFGIAIAGHLFEFGVFSRGVGGAAAFNRLGHTQDISSVNMGGVIGCIQAVVNMSRYLASWAVGQPTRPASFNNSFGVKHQLGAPILGSTKFITILSRTVHKEYNNYTPTDIKRMTDFYKATKGGLNLEQMLEDKVSADGKTVRFTLEPVGVPQPAGLPTTAAEIRSCLKQVVQALAYCQTKNWSVVDVRWSNVVKTSKGWVLIDAAEHATKHGQPLPNVNLAPALAVGSAATNYTDARQLEAMLLSQPALYAFVQVDGANQGPAFLAGLQKPKTPSQLQYLHYIAHA